ncbi:MAG: hypothetical protein ACI4R9_06150 [Kiritimatiellia bacterium]
MNVQNAVVAVAALVAGTAMGYFLRPAAESSAPASAVHETRKPLAGVADAEVKALRAQVKALQAQLAAKTADASATDGEKAAPDNGRDRGEEMRVRFDQWKKDHPEEFARMEKQRQAFMRRRAERAKSRQEFLASIDTSKMTAEEKETHAQLQSLLAKREDLEGRMAQMEDLSDDARGQLFEEMRETSHAIRELNAKEREALFRQMTAEMGVTGEDVDIVTSTIAEILEATENTHGPGGRGGPGGPGPGPGGPRGGGGR